MGSEEARSRRASTSAPLARRSPSGPPWAPLVGLIVRCSIAQRRDSSLPSSEAITEAPVISAPGAQLKAVAQNDNGRGLVVEAALLVLRVLPPPAAGANVLAGLDGAGAGGAADARIPLVVAAVVDALAEGVEALLTDERFDLLEIGEHYLDWDIAVLEADVLHHLVGLVVETAGVEREHADVRRVLGDDVLERHIL